MRCLRTVAVATVSAGLLAVYSPQSAAASAWRPTTGEVNVALEAANYGTATSGPVRSWALDWNLGGMAFANDAFMGGAAETFVEDVTGPLGDGYVIYFLFGAAGSDAAMDLGLQYGAMSTLHGAAEIEEVPGYPTPASSWYSRSRVWNQPGVDRFGGPTVATYAGVALPGIVVDQTSGKPGGVVVEALTVTEGQYPVPAGAATAVGFVQWGVRHLRYVLAHMPHPLPAGHDDCTVTGAGVHAKVRCRFVPAAAGG